MLYGIEGILNGKLFGNGEGGSSGGGITLPTLTNPAGADQILEGYEAVDGSGNKLTGTHVCESGGGDSSVTKGVLTVEEAVTVDGGMTAQQAPISLMVDGANVKKAVGWVVGTPFSFCIWYGANSRTMTVTNAKTNQQSQTLEAGEHEVYLI